MDDGLVDIEDVEEKDESSFDERLGGSVSATLLKPPLPAILWDSLLLLLLLLLLVVKLLLLAKGLEVLKLRVTWPDPLDKLELDGGATELELLRIRARSSVNLA